MSKATKATQNEGTSLDKLVKEGKALAAIWCKANSLKDTTKANGFDTRLGKLLQELKAQSSLDSGQISRQVLHTYGIHVIDRRRRAEALWFVENEEECRKFIAESKKGFTSLTALQAAMRKAAKAADEPNTAKAEPSNVGQSDDEQPKQPKAKPVSKQVVFDHLKAVCNANGIDPLEIAKMLIEDAEASKKRKAA